MPEERTNLLDILTMEGLVGVQIRISRIFSIHYTYRSYVLRSNLFFWFLNRIIKRFINSPARINTCPEFLCKRAHYQIVKRQQVLGMVHVGLPDIRQVE